MAQSSGKPVSMNLDLEALETAPNAKKALRKTIVELAGPSLAEMVLTNFIAMLNMIMVGRVGAVAVTTVGLTNNVVFFMLALFFALNTGTTAIIARAIGANDEEKANRAAQQAFLLNVSLSVTFSLVSYLFAAQLMTFMGAAPEVLKDGVLYAEITFSTLALVTISMGLSAVLRGAGDTKTPARINVISSVLVVVLGFPLIYGYFGAPEMGVIGVAVANAISKLLATVWLLSVLFRGENRIKLRLKNMWQIDRELIGRIVNVGLPAAGEQFALRTGQVVMAKIVAILGTTTFAAHQIAFNVLGLTFMPGMAFAAVAATLVGQALGAKKPELAEKFGWETRKIGSIIATSIGIGFIVLAPYIMMLYTNEQAVIDQGAIALRVIGFVQVAQSTQFILAGALRGAGDTKFPLYATFTGVWGFRVVLAVLFVPVMHLGILGAWLAVAADQVVRSLIIHTRYKRGKWKSVQV
jgi:putative MATE family efflux protein